MEKCIYPAIFHKEEVGGYSVTFPDLPGCNTEGNDLAEALYMAQNALGLYLYSLKQDKEPLPQASRPELLTLNKDSFVTLVEWDEVFRNFMTTTGSKEDFDAMMQAGYDDALANRSEDADEVFARIRQRIENMVTIRKMLYENEPLTQEQIQKIEEANKRPIVFDNDCPEFTESQLMKIAAMATKQRAVRRKALQ